MCQCPLFKQFTTRMAAGSLLRLVFIVCVNVLFLSNSQPSASPPTPTIGVYRMCQCPLFKQFTTWGRVQPRTAAVFIVCVNVLFLSNSQQQRHNTHRPRRCLSYVSMSSF